MPDPLRKAQRGQKLKDGLSAAAWNSFIDNLKSGLETGAGDITDAVDPANTALLVWDGDPEQSLQAFSVLGYGDAIRTPEDNPFVASARPIFESAEAEADRPFVITLKPVGGGKVVKVVTMGLVAVQVEITDEDHTRACPIAGTTSKLASSVRGVPIIYKESGTGTKWAIVRLGGDPPPPWGVDYDTRHNSHTNWLNEYLYLQDDFAFEYTTVLPLSELIIPANTGWVWVEGGITVIHGPITSPGSTPDLAAAAYADVVDIDEDYIGDSTKRWGETTFAQGQVSNVLNGGSGSAFTRLSTGACTTEHLGGPGGFPFATHQGGEFQGRITTGFLIYVGDTARRLCWRGGVRVNSPTGHSFDGFFYNVVIPHTGGGRSWLTYQPIDFEAREPDLDDLVVSFTEDPDNGSHVSPHAVDFDSTVTGGTPSYSYSWVFGDGSVSTTADPSRTYVNSGIFIPTVMVTDDIGQMKQAYGNPILITGGSPPPPPPPPPVGPPPTPPIPVCDWDAADIPDLNINLPDGADAGDYTATLESYSGGIAIWRFDVDGTIGTVTYFVSGDVFYVSDGSLSAGATTYTCGPFSATFDDANGHPFGTTNPIVATEA